MRLLLLMPHLLDGSWMEALTEVNASSCCQHPPPCFSTIAASTGCCWSLCAHLVANVRPVQVWVLVVFAQVGTMVITIQQLIRLQDMHTTGSACYSNGMQCMCTT